MNAVEGFKGVLHEFQKFIQRGNVIDLAVGVIMGGAFGKIVNSLVSDVVMPPLGLITGGVNFKDQAIKFQPIQIPDPVHLGQMKTLPAVSINYGNFIQVTVEFLLMAFCIFLLVKGMNALQKKKEEAPPPEPTPTEKLLMEIRDALKARAE